MRRFVRRALEKIAKLDEEQIRQLVKELAHENETLEVVLDSMNDGVLVSDAEHRLILFNKNAERLLPLHAGRAQGERHIWDVIEDLDISGFIRNSLENDDTVVDREFALDTSGTTRLLSFSVLPLVEAGHIRGNLVRITDISDRRSREARLRRAENLASLTTLAAGVAHEIKNPLGSIGIHTQLMEKALNKVDFDSRDTVLGYLEVIQEEIQRLNKIVVDFLFAVRPMDIQLEEGNLNQLVSDLISFLRFELEENHIDLSVKLDPNLPLLEIDQKYLKQAIMNIVKNAISAMPEGGTLAISTADTNGTAQLKISDTGVGIPDDVMDKIFEPYFTTKDFGSGIGLTLVYKVVKEHMGDISVDSREGIGTSFTIRLPVPQKETHLLSWQGEADDDVQHSDS